MWLAHENSLAGHLGMRKIARTIFQFSVGQQLYCKTLVTCQEMGKQKQGVQTVLFQLIPVAEEPFKGVVIDCVGLLSRTKGGNQCVDTCLRYCRGELERNTERDERVV